MTDPVTVQNTTTVSMPISPCYYLHYNPCKMLKNNTHETFKLWKQLEEFEDCYNKDKEIHDKPLWSTMRSLIQKLHNKLMDYKHPKEEWVVLDPK